LGGSTDITPGYGNVAPYSSPTEMALVGVFGGPSLPLLWTVFQIGASDIITVPTDATKLYLGIADSLGFNNPPGYYNDNTGYFTVSVTGESAAAPLPSTWTMLIAGFVGLGFFAHRGSKKNGATLSAA